MAGRLLVDGELDLTASSPDGGETTVHVRAQGTRIDIEIDNPRGLVDLRGRRWAAGIADQLARDGLCVSVVWRGKELVRMGTSVHAPLWQRRLTGSRNIRVRKLRRFVRAATPSFGSGTALPGANLLPPATPVPLFPTLIAPTPTEVTTTHDPYGGGDPRLVVPAGPWPWDEAQVHHLRHGVTTIGSHPDNDIVLALASPFQAEVRRDEFDEYVLVHLGGELPTRVHGARVSRSVLRTGSRVQVGDAVLAYVRAEYADHGRPHGGRLGGEVGHQRPQPPLRSVPNPAGFDAA